MQVYDATADSRTDYISGPNGALARIKKTDGIDTTTFIHADHLGTARAGTAVGGAELWEDFHTPFGESLIHPDATDDQGDYTGHIRDKATGLTYMQARYQDPLIGRFLSIDPVTFMDTGHPGMFNRYAYTWNDPVNLTDPNGAMPFPPNAFVYTSYTAAGASDEQASAVHRASNSVTSGSKLGKTLSIFGKHNAHAKSMGNRSDLGTATDGDKFEHFMANHEATIEVDAEMAEVVSDAKEGIDLLTGRNTPQESGRDQTFNEAGREAGEAGLSTSEAIKVGTDMVNTNRAEHLPAFEPRNDDEHP